MGSKGTRKSRNGKGSEFITPRTVVHAMRISIPHIKQLERGQRKAVRRELD